MPQVNTVLGPIKPEELGTTALHEHIQFGQPGWDLDPLVTWDDAEGFEKIKNDLLAFKQAGGKTLVDLSGMANGRDVEFYQCLSRASGVHVVACTGFWALNGIPGRLRSASADFFEELFVSELTQGMLLPKVLRRSEARAGIIKVAIDSFAQQPHPTEEAPFRAAARAAKRTGCAIATHGITHAYRQMEIFEEEGIDPTRVYIGHAEAAYALDLERDKEICRRGYYLGYDHIGYEPHWSTAPYAMPDEKRVELTKAMVDAGYVSQLIISCDTNGRSLSAQQKQHGYAWLLDSFVPKLLRAGITETQIQTMLVETPRKLLPMG